MSAPEARRNDASTIGNGDPNHEVVVIPVSEIDLAKELYKRLGWGLDVTPPGVVQLTLHRSGCSVQVGTVLTSAEAGTARGYPTVSDVEASRDGLIAADVEVAEVFHVGPDGPSDGPAEREANRRGRSLLAGLVRRVHGPRADGQGVPS